MCNALLQVFEHGVCVFKHLYCSAQLSMSSMEKRYRNKIIIIIIIIITIIIIIVLLTSIGLFSFWCIQCSFWCKVSCAAKCL